MTWKEISVSGHFRILREPLFKKVDVEASWGHRSDAYAYASRDYTRVVTKVTSWKKLTKQQVFVSQLTQFPRSVHHRLTFSQDVTVCDKFKNVISVPFDFMNKIPISRSTNGCSRKKSRWKNGSTKETELVKFRVEEERLDYRLRGRNIFVSIFQTIPVPWYYISSLFL